MPETPDPTNGTTKEELLIAEGIDPVAFEFPLIPGAIERQNSAIKRARHIVALLGKSGYKLSQESSLAEGSNEQAQ